MLELYFKVHTYIQFLNICRYLPFCLFVGLWPVAVLNVFVWAEACWMAVGHHGTTAKDNNIIMKDKIVIENGGGIFLISLGIIANPRRNRKWYIMGLNYIPKYQQEIKFSSLQ
jgi:hypothetical protein